VLKKPLLTILLVISGLLLLGIFSLPALRRNLTSIAVAKSLIQNRDVAATYQSLADSTSPRAIWQQALLAARLPDAALYQAHLFTFLASADFAALDLVHAVQPLDPTMATFAVQRYPDRSSAWFWLGETLSQSDDKTQAISAYQQTVSLDPTDALAWCRLGYLLNGLDLLAARDAYTQCCHHGDPGSNGCVNAGRIYEETGDYPQALHYYRLSRWSESLRRADELEARLATP